jgi:hypothetical protein
MSTGTPPPPMPEGFAPVPPALVAEPAPPALSEPQRIINTYFAPTKTFEDIRRNPSWWVPWLLISLLAIAFWVMVGKNVGYEKIARDTIAQSARMQQLPPDVQAQQVKGMTIGFKYFGYATPIFLLVYGLIMAAILMVVFNFTMEAQVPFKQSLSIVMYAWALPAVLSTIVSMIAVWKGDPDNFYLQNPSATNPAYFMDPASTSKFLYTFLMAFDVFSIWSVILMGIGFAANSNRRKVKTSTAIVTIAVLFLLLKLGAAGFAAMRG